jgi:hypothetical protein
MPTNSSSGERPLAWRIVAALGRLLLVLTVIAAVIAATTALIASTVPQESRGDAGTLALIGLFALALAAAVPFQWRKPTGLIDLEKHAPTGEGRIPRPVSRFLLRGLFPIAVTFFLGWIAFMLDAYGVDFATSTGRTTVYGVLAVLGVWLVASGLFRRPRILMPYDYRVDLSPENLAANPELADELASERERQAKRARTSRLAARRARSGRER